MDDKQELETLAGRLKIVRRVRPEPYSCTIAVRVRPSEKRLMQEYATKIGVTLDALMRSALVAVGILNEHETGKNEQAND